MQKDAKAAQKYFKYFKYCIRSGIISTGRAVIAGIA
jgi:hypothetical protein